MFIVINAARRNVKMTTGVILWLNSLLRKLMTLRKVLLDGVVEVLNGTSWPSWSVCPAFEIFTEPRLFPGLGLSNSSLRIVRGERWILLTPEALDCVAAWAELGIGSHVKVIAKVAEAGELELNILASVRTIWLGGHHTMLHWRISRTFQINVIRALNTSDCLGATNACNRRTCWRSGLLLFRLFLLETEGVERCRFGLFKIRLGHISVLLDDQNAWALTFVFVFIRGDLVLLNRRPWSLLKQVRNPYHFSWLLEVIFYSRNGEWFADSIT